MPSGPSSSLFLSRVVRMGVLSFDSVSSDPDARGASMVERLLFI